MIGVGDDRDEPVRELPDVALEFAGSHGKSIAPGVLARRVPGEIPAKLRLAVTAGGTA
ncbi:hypothetical protein GCM10017566_20890 [Amycolatopsis bartoniae]|uniref:Uncharacterized protein n=1 Tax=Amycolatopsis bartoniae TaxID=941986 RepID=A0A8H9IU19_9PSEU|nr:hypothetical protein GCM10017566_20890 [Amycolatopsis bartoniae]